MTDLIRNQLLAGKQVEPHDLEELRGFNAAQEAVLVEVEQRLESLAEAFASKIRERPQLFAADKEDYSMCLEHDFGGLRAYMRKQEAALRTKIDSIKAQQASLSVELRELTAAYQTQLTEFMARAFSEKKTDSKFRRVYSEAFGRPAMNTKGVYYKEWPSEEELRELPPDAYMSQLQVGFDSCCRFLKATLSTGQSSRGFCWSDFGSPETLELPGPFSVSKVRAFEGALCSFDQIQLLGPDDQVVASSSERPGKGDWHEIRIGAIQQIVGVYAWIRGKGIGHLFRFGFVLREHDP